MGFVLILGLFTVGVTLPNVHGVGLAGGLGGFGADLNINLGSQLSAAAGGYSGHKHIGVESAIGGSSPSGFVVESSSAYSGDLKGAQHGAIGSYGGGKAVGHRRTESASLGLGIGLGLSSGNAYSVNKDSYGSEGVGLSLGNGKGNAFGRHKIDSGLINIGGGIVGLAAPSSVSVSASAVNSNDKESKIVSSTGAISSSEGKVEADISGGHNDDHLLSGSSTAGISGSLGFAIESGQSDSASDSTGKSFEGRDASRSTHSSSYGSGSTGVVTRNYASRTTQTSTSGDYRNSGMLSSGTIATGGYMGGQSASHTSSYDNHSDGKLQYTASSGSLSDSSSSGAGLSFDAAGIRDIVSIHSASVSNTGHDNGHSHSAGAATSSSTIGSSSSSSGYKVLKHETYRSTDGGLRGSSEVGINMGSSVVGSKLNSESSSSDALGVSTGRTFLPGSLFDSSVSLSLDSTRVVALSDTGVNSGIKPDSGSSAGAGLAGYSLINPGSLNTVGSGSLSGPSLISDSSYKSLNLHESSNREKATIAKHSSPTITSTGKYSISSETLKSGSFDTDANAGIGIGIGLVLGRGVSSSAGSISSNNAISEASAGTATAIKSGNGAHLSDTQIISLAQGASSSKISGASISLGANAASSAISSGSSLTSKNSPDISGSLSDMSVLYGSGSTVTSSKGGYGTKVSTQGSVHGAHSSGTSNILSPVGGLIGDLHKSVHGSYGGYGDSSSIVGTSAHRSEVTNTAGSTGVLGSLLGAHASIGGGLQASGDYGSLERYSSGHKGNYAGSLNSGTSASAGSSLSSGTLSGGFSLGLGR